MHRPYRLWPSSLTISALLVGLLASSAVLATAPPPDPASDDPVILSPDGDDDPVILSPDDDDQPVILEPDDAPVTLEAEVFVSDAKLTGWLKEGEALRDDDEHLAASLRFDEVVKSGAPDNPIVQNAAFQLGVALYELGLYQSALSRFEDIVDMRDKHPKYAKTLSYLLRISRATGSDPSVLARLAEYPVKLYPAEDKDEIQFLVGQYLYSESQLEEALPKFRAVTTDSPEFYVRAKYLEGVILIGLSRLGTGAQSIDGEKLGEAAEAFKTVLRYQRDEGGSDTVDRVSQKAILALGRLFYSTRQYDVAVRYYDQIEQGTASWLDALYEVSWVQYQLKNYPRALGNLETLNSPFFTDQYYPESRVLQALILFYNCRYDESHAIVKAFFSEYYPLMTRLRKEINQFGDPNAFYNWLAKLSVSTDSEYSERFKRIFNAALTDKKLRRKFDLVAKLNRELKRVDELAGPDGAKEGLLARLKGDLGSYQTLVVGEAGGLAQSRLLRVLKDLKRHLAGALKIRGETLKAKRGDAADSVVKEQAAAKAAREEIEVDDEHIEWPFTGEYWKDELGSYLYDIDSQCEDAGDEAAPSPAP